MSRDDSIIPRIPPSRLACPLDVPSSRTHHTDMIPRPESPSRRIQRWIGEQDPPAPASTATAIPSIVCDSDEDCAREQHEFDWELEEFEREMALRFVMNRDLKLGFEDREICTWGPKMPMGARSTMAPTANLCRRKPWLRSVASTSTLQPRTKPSAPPSSFHFPPTPTTPSSSARPSLFGLFCPPTPMHKPSPSVLSLTSHPSSYTASREEASPSVCHSSDARSARSFAAHLGSKLKYGLLAPSKHSPAPSSRNLPSSSASVLSSRTLASPSSLSSGAFPFPPLALRSRSLPPLSREFASETSPVSPGASSRTAAHASRSPPASPYTGHDARVEIGTGTRGWRRVSVPDVLAPKKRRLIVRGVGADDEYAVEGLRRWARALGEVSRICRTKDGAIWIEFRDRRVAESVCCVQAQVQIPHVGRVVLDWAEGRQCG